MKIVAVRATDVCVPVRHPPGLRLLLGRTHIERTIVQVETDAGIVGLGETRGPWSTELIRHRFAPALEGLDPLDRRGAEMACTRRRHPDHGHPEHLVERMAFAGVEVALWDIAGKAAGQPLYRLLGGRARDQARFGAPYGYPAEGAPDEAPRRLAEHAARVVEETGAEFFELKVGRLPPQVELASLRALRSALGPRIRLGIDANMRWDEHGARRFLLEAAEVGLDNAEELVPSPAAMSRLARESGVPASTHLIRPEALLAHSGIAGVASDPPAHGGIAGFVAFADAVPALGRRIWLRAVWELGISWAVHCHLALALPALDRPSQCLLGFAEHDLVQGGGWPLRRGGVSVPDAPGLGVAVDQDALARYASSPPAASAPRPCA